MTIPGPFSSEIKAKREKNDAIEKYVAVEGLLKLEQDGGALKNLENQVASLKCELANERQEKDDLIDQHEDAIYDAEESHKTEIAQEREKRVIDVTKMLWI
uniref:Uncharacterized protein n=1 Tax=Lotharella globosa TaxID=91324 RepID=A0A7S3Y913_9EUKA